MSVEAEINANHTIAGLGPSIGDGAVKVIWKLGISRSLLSVIGKWYK